MAVTNLAGSDQHVAGLEWAADLPPDLITEVRQLWPGAPRMPSACLELFHMACVLGYAEDLDNERLLHDLPALPAKMAARTELPTLSPDIFDFAAAVADRYQALTDPAFLERYVRVIRSLWAELRPRWLARGLAAVEQECTFLREMLPQRPWLDLLPPKHIIHMEIFTAAVRLYTEQVPTVIIPSYFAVGPHFMDFAHTLYVGYGLETDGRLKRQMARSRATGQLLKALADPTRLTILMLATKLPVTVSDIASYLEIAQPTVSEHLRILRDAGLATVTRQGRQAFYHADGAAVQRLLETVRELTE